MLEDQTISRLVPPPAAPALSWDGIYFPAFSPSPIQELWIARGSRWPSAAPSVAAGPS
jgi:hypothetical protein